MLPEIWHTVTQTLRENSLNDYDTSFVSATNTSHGHDTERIKRSRVANLSMTCSKSFEKSSGTDVKGLMIFTTA